MKYMLSVLFLSISSVLAASIASRAEDPVCTDSSKFYVLPDRQKDPRSFIYCVHGNPVVAQCPDNTSYYDYDSNSCVV